MGVVGEGVQRRLAALLGISAFMIPGLLLLGGLRASEWLSVGWTVRLSTLAGGLLLIVPVGLGVLGQDVALAGLWGELRRRRGRMGDGGPARRRYGMVGSDGAPGTRGRRSRGLLLVRDPRWDGTGPGRVSDPVDPHYRAPRHHRLVCSVPDPFVETTRTVTVGPAGLIGPISSP